MTIKSPPVDEKFEVLLDYLRRTRGFDFTGYKRSSLMRRVRKRMQTVGHSEFDEYMDYLEVHPDEFAQLFNNILINVTAFFRDPESWQFLAAEVLPRIVRSHEPHDQIRVWSVGCASGEEAYTLASLLTELLGPDQFRQRVKIYATDVDEEALTQARHAGYTAGDVDAVPVELRDKYFELVGGRYQFRSDLRRSVIFGRHDLVQDAPIGRLDLLVCRNTLMYFNAEAQAKILSRFHFALNSDGYLFLGKAEMLLTHTALFVPVELRHRVFGKVSRLGMLERAVPVPEAVPVDPANQMGRHIQLRDLSFDAGPVPHIVIDQQAVLLLANSPARNMFHMGGRDVGRSLFDLPVSYRPVELRPLIDKVNSERRSVSVTNVEHHADGHVRYLDLIIVPLADNGGTVIGASIVFTDVTPRRQMQEDVQRFRLELETAYEELQSTNEELETTNEELQSTVEELETTNEELQSTNEELETMNEELQSTNEELETMNIEMQKRADEVNQANLLLTSILSSMKAAVVVLSRDYAVLTWNAQAEELWGLRADEVRGRPFFGLDIGLPVEKLMGLVSTCILGEPNREELELDAVNRRGHPVRARVECVPLIGRSQERLGVVLSMDVNRS